MIKLSEVRDKCVSVSHVIQTYGSKHALYYIPFLKKENINLDELLQFLKDSYSEESKKNTDLRKIICFYDYLKYGIQLDLIDLSKAMED